MPELIDKVYDNWDNIVAVAFLPKDCSHYPQMPYEELTQEQYQKMVSTFPDLSDFEDLVDKYERGELDDDLEADPGCAGSVCPVR